MRQRTGVVALTLALVFGLLGSATAFIYLNRQTRISADPDHQFEPVIVATTDLTYGTTLRPEHLRVAFYPVDSVPSGAIADADSLVGQTTKVFLAQKEAIISTKLTSVGGGLSLRIPKTMRATSMNVNIVSGVSGFVLPGDRVDVLVVIDRYGKNREAVTRTILQDVEVLAAGQKTKVKNDNPVKVQSVTLLVEPVGAERLALALHEGKLHLVLRNPGDHELATVRSITTSDIMSNPRTIVKRKTTRRRTVVRKPEKTTVTVIKGVEVEEQEPPVEEIRIKSTDKGKGKSNQ